MRRPFGGDFSGGIPRPGCGGLGWGRSLTPSRCSLIILGLNYKTTTWLLVGYRIIIRFNHKWVNMLNRAIYWSTTALGKVWGSRARHAQIRAATFCRHGQTAAKPTPTHPVHRAGFLCLRLKKISPLALLDQAMNYCDGRASILIAWAHELQCSFIWREVRVFPDQGVHPWNWKNCQESYLISSEYQQSSLPSLRHIHHE